MGAVTGLCCVSSVCSRTSLCNVQFSLHNNLRISLQLGKGRIRRKKQFSNIEHYQALLVNQQYSVFHSSQIQ